MNPKSVVFIEPKSSKTNVFDNYMRLPLMGSLYLGTILHNRGHTVRLLNENILQREIDITNVDADVFCLTALSTSARRARMLAVKIRECHPVAKILIGGIHASLLPEDFIDVADHVVVGEAEDIIVDLVEGRIREKLVHGAPVDNLDTLPIVNFRLLEGIEKLRTIPIMTSRGCPYDCTFCSVTKIFGRRFRMQSPSRIIAEIESARSQIHQNIGFFFYDDNFTAVHERIDELCREMIRRKLNIRWTTQVRVNLTADPGLIRTMVQAGLRWVYVGFESVNDKTLKDLHKSQTVLDIENAIRIFRECGVSVHGMFMLGEDNDTVEGIAQALEFTIRTKIDSVQFMILTPLPGTVLFDRLDREGRLLHKDWDYYNGMFVVFRPKHITAEELMRRMFGAYVGFYSIPRTIRDSFHLAARMAGDMFIKKSRRKHRYRIDTIVKRLAARMIVKRYHKSNTDYVKNVLRAV